MDNIQIEILEDGTISVKTEEISEKNHKSADELLEEFEELLGTKRRSTPVKHKFWNNHDVQRGGKIVKVNG